MNSQPPKEKKPKSRAAKIAGILSCVLWVAGFALAFVVPPKSPNIWVPDTLLLCGFLPLLFVWRFSWPWIVFGLFNAGIGIFLQAIEYLPDDLFPPQAVIGKHHLADYHEPLAWVAFGIVVFAYGIVRLSKNLILWTVRKSKERNETTVSSVVPPGTDQEVL